MISEPNWASSSLSAAIRSDDTEPRMMKQMASENTAIKATAAVILFTFEPPSFDSRPNPPARPGEDFGAYSHTEGAWRKAPGAVRRAAGTAQAGRAGLGRSRRAATSEAPDPGGEDEQDDAQQVQVEVRAEEGLQPGVGHHLHADHHQDEGERDLQVAELVDHPGEGEVEAAQAEDREDVAREDEERVGGDREDRRDRVHREDEVGELDHHQRQEERGGEEDARPGRVDHAVHLLGGARGRAPRGRPPSRRGRRSAGRGSAP